jgi:hypothetical protein
MVDVSDGFYTIMLLLLYCVAFRLVRNSKTDGFHSGHTGQQAFSLSTKKLQILTEELFYPEGKRHALQLV